MRRALVSRPALPSNFRPRIPRRGYMMEEEAWAGARGVCLLMRLSAVARQRGWIAHSCPLCRQPPTISFQRTRFAPQDRDDFRAWFRAEAVCRVAQASMPVRETLWTYASSAKATHSAAKRMRSVSGRNQLRLRCGVEPRFPTARLDRCSAATARGLHDDAPSHRAQPEAGRFGPPQ